MSTATAISIEDRLRIDELYAAYVSCLDGGRYEEWPEFFTEECTYRVVPRENYDRGLPLSTLSFESKAMLRDRVYGITQTLFHEPYYQRHLVSGILVRPADGARSGLTLRQAQGDNGDADFVAEANYLVIRTKAGRLSEVYNAGRYYDRVVDDGGVLRFREKICVFDSELIPNSMIYPV